jgi:hypothetical protein
MYKRGTFLHYFVRVTLERPDRYKFNVLRQYPVKVVTCSSPLAAFPSPSVTHEARNRDDLHLRAALTNPDPVRPGIDLVLDVNLHNPKRVIVKSITAKLIQYRAYGIYGPYPVEIFEMDLTSLKRFSDEQLQKTSHLPIPVDLAHFIPSFHYDLSGSVVQDIRVTYMLVLEVNVEGFFKNFSVSIPVVMYPKIEQSLQSTT